MARIHFVESVAVALGPGGTLMPVPGVGATPMMVDASSQQETVQAAAYANRTGPGLASMLGDQSGVISFWLESGDYNVHVVDPQNPPRIAPYVRGFSG